MTYAVPKILLLTAMKLSGTFFDHDITKSILSGPYGSRYGKPRAIMQRVSSQNYAVGHRSLRGKKCTRKKTLLKIHNNRHSEHNFGLLT